MCLSPRIIPNRNYKPSDSLSPAFIQVPCGRCEHCKQMRIAEMLFRTEWHRQMIESLGGFSFFVTLTFNPSNLNTIQYCNKDGEVVECSTWNNDALCKFFKRYRKLCSKYDIELSYIATPERGKTGSYIDDKGRKRFKTARPHYHVILYHAPSSPVAEDVKRELWLSLPCCWSSYKAKNRFSKKNYAIDLSTKRPNSYYEAAFEPIGRIYNEEIGRGAAKATKYVVKYAFKDYTDTTFNVDPTRIISSKFCIAFKHMTPKLLQSQGIGLYFRAWLYNQYPDVDLAISMANYVGSLTDGSVTRVPRYFIQQLSRDIALLDKYPVEDLSKTWVGDHVGLAHEDGKRNLTKSESSRTDFGTTFLLSMHQYAKEDLYHDLQSFIQRGGFEYQYCGVQPFDPQIGLELHSRLCASMSNSEIIDVLSGVPRETFEFLYDIVYHGFAHTHLLSSLDECQFKLYRAFTDYCLHRQMNNLYNKSRGLYMTAKRYAENKHKAARENPALFNTPINTDD